MNRVKQLKRQIAVEINSKLCFNERVDGGYIVELIEQLIDEKLFGHKMAFRHDSRWEE